MPIVEPIAKYVDQVLLKFKNANGYSDMPFEAMRLSIRDYLLEAHDSDMEALALQMEIEQLQNKEIDQEYYKKAYAKIKRNLVERVAALSFTGEDNTKLLT